jgi:hypothetical protein
MKNAENIGALTIVRVVIIFCFLAVITHQEMAVAQMTINELWCTVCNAQEESGAEVEGERTAQVITDGTEDPSTVDDFIADINAERDFDDRRIAEEQEENGIRDAENLLSVRVNSENAKAMLINQIFTKLLNNIAHLGETASPDIQVVEEEIGADETVQRQIISYEFNEDIEANDDTRIYTSVEETIQSLASTLDTFTNETNIDLYANGRMIINYAGESGSDERDDTRIYAPHNYTTVNGYRYLNSTIYDHNGIEVLADPNTTNQLRTPT